MSSLSKEVPGRERFSPVLPQDQDYYREHDKESNAKGRLPNGEQVDVVTVWIAECYSPSMIEGLLDSLRNLGWDESETRYGGFNESPVQWIQKTRWSVGGWSSLPINLIVRPEDSEGRLRPYEVTVLPENCEHASGHFFHLFSGLFVFVMQFHVRATVGQLIGDALNKDYHTYARSLTNGFEYVSVGQQRRDAVARVRQDTVDDARSWMKKHLPGVFASSKQSINYPWGELITLETGKPADPDERPDWESYIAILGLDRTFEAWSSDKVPGMQLLLPSGTAKDLFSLVLAANASELFADKDLSVYGGRTRFGFNHHASHLDYVFAAWALNALLYVYETRYAEIREKMSVPLDLEAISSASSQISNLETSLMTTAVDALTVTLEMTDFLQNRNRFFWGLAEFHPVHPNRYLRKKPVEGESPAVSGSGNGSGGTDSQEQREPFFENMRIWMLRRCAWVVRTDNQARELVQAQSTIVNSRAQHELAKSNNSIQRVVFRLSVVVVIAALLQFGFSVFSYFHPNTVVPVTVEPSTPTPETTKSRLTEWHSGAETLGIAQLVMVNPQVARLMHADSSFVVEGNH